MATIKFCSWNVNGLKSVLNNFDRLDSFLDSLDSDIICIQETKLKFVNESRLCIAREFYSYFACNQSREKMAIGYSGVATFVRKRTDINCVAAQIGLTGMLSGEGKHRADGQIVSVTDDDLLSLDITRDEALRIDAEGRIVITDHGLFVLINAYAPYSPMEDVTRYNYKLNFNALLRCVISKLHCCNRRVVLMGDLNVSAYPIDHCDPGDYYYPAPATDGSGDDGGDGAQVMVCVKFADKPHVRWFREMTTECEDESDYLVDSFRAKHPEREEAYTCWNMLTSARLTNYGTRIDYILVSRALTAESVAGAVVPVYAIADADICPDVLGSDHCPVKCTLLRLEDAPSADLDQCMSGSKTVYVPPSLCTCHTPMYSQKQLSLADALAAAKYRPSAALSCGGKDAPVAAVASSSVGPALPSVALRKRSASDTLSSGGRNAGSGSKDKPVDRKKQAMLNFGVSAATGADVGASLGNSKMWVCPRCTYENTIPLTVGSGPSIVTCTICENGQVVPIAQGGASSFSQSRVSIAAASNLPAPTENTGTSLQVSSSAAASASSTTTGNGSSATVDVFSVLKQSQTPLDVPLCSGHNRPCVAHIVYKEGPNKGRRFFCCKLPAGKPNAPNAKCSFFKWDENFRQMVKLK